MALRFNNNREFFQSNREWYLKSVREPSLALAEALSPAIEKIDPGIETRPHRALARINRDTRFSHDKSPYRDHVWISFRRPEEERGRFPSFFIEVGVEGVFYGMGAYAPERARMNALRRRLRLAPEEPEACLRNWTGALPCMGKPTSASPCGGAAGSARSPLYSQKLLLGALSALGRACSAALAVELAADFSRLKPLYDYMAGCSPEEEDYL